MEKFIEMRDGAKIFVKIIGSGEPILLLHGNGNNFTFFEKQIIVFQKDFKVIAMDTRGHGKSDKNYDLNLEDLSRDVFEVLDWLEERLAHRRFIMGEHITETDIRTYTTLIRFDAVYHGHFKTNRNKISEMPNVYGYLRELFQLPGFGDTTDFTEIKQHYYIVHREINPTQIVPAGPDLSGLAQPHGRDHLPGAPFAEGTTLPGPLPEAEQLKNPADFQR